MCMMHVVQNMHRSEAIRYLVAGSMPGLPVPGTRYNTWCVAPYNVSSTPGTTVTQLKLKSSTVVPGTPMSLVPGTGVFFCC